MVVRSFKGIELDYSKGVELMQELSIIEQAVLKLIPVGNERKISIREIESLIDLDERTVYGIVNSLRKKGVPVCAKRNGLLHERGYYIATNEAERVDGLAAYKSQVQDMQNLINDIENASLETWREDLNLSEESA